MGLFDKLRAKKERLHIDPETKESSWIPVKQTKEKKVIKELTHAEQFPEARKHPWQTERGKRTIKSAKEGIKRIDKAVVNYNRRQASRPPPSHRQPAPSYSIDNNYNPFGSLFDTGINYDRPSSKKKSSGKKKSKRKSKNKYSSDWDVFGAFGKM